jgi:hypothetical protein
MGLISVPSAQQHHAITFSDLEHGSSIVYYLCYSVFQRFTKVDIELGINITIGTVQNES